MNRLIFVMLLVLTSTALAEVPTELPEEGPCAVCARRGAAHGAERYVDWREHEGTQYGFCSKGCAEAFDQMPLGYVEPVFPRAAPEFRWSALDGSAIKPTGQSALLVDFWATWCQPCLAAMPELEQLADEFADDGLRVVGISIDEKRETLDTFLQRRPVEYPVVHDGGEDPAWWQFRVPAIPAVFLVNADGEIVAQWSGAIDGDDVRAQVEAVLGKE